MKLVLLYRNNNYLIRTAIPIEYKSKQDLLYDFRCALNEAIRKKISFYFSEKEFDKDLFYIKDLDKRISPEVYSLDEWFDLFKI